MRVFDYKRNVRVPREEITSWFYLFLNLILSVPFGFFANWGGGGGGEMDRGRIPMGIVWFFVFTC